MKTLPKTFRQQNFIMQFVRVALANSSFSFWFACGALNLWGAISIEKMWVLFLPLAMGLFYAASTQWKGEADYMEAMDRRQLEKILNEENKAG